MTPQRNTRGAAHQILKVVDGAPRTPLRDLLIHGNWKVADFAAAVGVNDATVSSWLRTGNVPGKHLTKVCTVLDCHYTDLIPTEEYE